MPFRFLKENAFKSVDRNLLWASLNTYADHGADKVELSGVMRSWLDNPGVPEVIVRCALRPIKRLVSYSVVVEVTKTRRYE